ncbi:MAG: hypothetical protein DMD49_12390 [Gemmatimonadetes bacterium]|nr:MAG: hypothetical protein DMD49_12390 [Gemmatimonadota bacterium]
MNPLVTVHPLAKQVQKYVLLTTLARYDTALTPQPYLARAWRWAPDGRTLTFRLFRGLRWGDGQSTTARDVSWTLNTARDPATGYPRLETTRRWSCGLPRPSAGSPMCSPTSRFFPPTCWTPCRTSGCGRRRGTSTRWGTGRSASCCTSRIDGGCSRPTRHSPPRWAARRWWIASPWSSSTSPRPSSRLWSAASSTWPGSNPRTWPSSGETERSRCSIIRCSSPTASSSTSGVHRSRSGACVSPWPWRSTEPRS